MFKPFGVEYALLFQGRVSCEVSAADELMLTEMMFGGIFTNLSTSQLAALLSCFVFEEKAGNTKLADDLSGCLRAMQVSYYY